MEIYASDFANILNPVIGQLVSILIVCHFVLELRDKKKFSHTRSGFLLFLPMWDYKNPPWVPL